MENQIKNFIEEGEKEFNKEIEKLNDIYYDTDGYEKLKFYLKTSNNLLCRSEVYPETQYELDPDKIKQFISSRQISLIKMIVEEINDINFYSWNEETQRMIKDTISSKLKELYEK